jgi:hypothetical protein
VRKRVANLAISVMLLSGVPGMSSGDEILRDPTRPYAASEGGVAAAPRFLVNAIIVSSERRVAIVNGQRVVIGESVHGATVVAIEKDQLTLEKDGERITARLSHGAPRQ